MKQLAGLNVSQVTLALLTIALFGCGNIEKGTKQIIGEHKPENPKQDPQPPLHREPNPPNMCLDALALSCAPLPHPLPLYSHYLSFGDITTAPQIEFTGNPCTALILNLSDANVKLSDIKNPSDATNPAKLDESITITLNSGSVTGKFYQDSACANTMTNVTLAAGKSQTDVFYFKESTANITAMYSLSATVTTKQNAKNISIQAASIVVHAKPTPPPPLPRLKFSTPATGASVKVGQCQTLDIAIDESATGQTAPIKNTYGDIRISLLTSSLTGSYYRDSGCTDRINAVTFTAGAVNVPGIYYRDFTVGSVALEAHPTSGNVNTPPLVQGTEFALRLNVAP